MARPVLGPAGPRPRLDVALPLSVPVAGGTVERIPAHLGSETFGRAGSAADQTQKLTCLSGSGGDELAHLGQAVS
jgi:hypothetical protein